MMSARIVISPWSKTLLNNKQNAKNYQQWEEVVSQLRASGHKVIQVGIRGEPPIGADEFLLNLTLNKLQQLVEGATTWASVDNFFPHFCANFNRWGVVVWGKSDPLIFGYPSNINLLRDRRHLRANQFEWWQDPNFPNIVEPFDPKVFVTPDRVVYAIELRIKQVHSPEPLLAQHVQS